VALAVAVGLLTAACTFGAPEPVEIAIDGGGGQVAVIEPVTVAARAGQTVTVRHAGERAMGAEAPVTHALVAAPLAALPPLFVDAGAGRIPNAGVWGPCRGGDAADAVGGCPVPPVEGPESWDGSAYWSTGAMVPGETRDIPLAGDIADREYQLVCALHPDLVVTLAVGAGSGADTVTGAPVVDQDAEALAEQAAADLPPATVLAGVAVDDPSRFVGAFAPQRLEVAVGQSVTWQASARAPVDVVFGEQELSLSHTDPADGLPEGDPDGWDGTGTLRSGFLSADPNAGAEASAWTVTFRRPGEYPYASRFADGMTGTVVVTRP